MSADRGGRLVTMVLVGWSIGFLMIGHTLGQCSGRNEVREEAELVGTGGFVDDGRFFWNVEWPEYAGPLICERDRYMLFKERTMCRDDGGATWQIGKVVGHQKWEIK